MHKPIPIRFSQRHRRSLYVVFALLWASGALWLLFHYFMQTSGEFGDLPHPAEKWWLRLHGLMVIATLIALGSVLPGHAKRAWQLRKNHHSGLMMKATFAWLTLTGYALYYFASEANENWLPLLHWSVGLAAPIMLALHIRKGRAKRAAVPSGRPAYEH